MVPHRKRRDFIPMFDTVVLKYYLDALGRSELKERSQVKAHAAATAVEALKGFREDLRQALPEITALQARLAHAGLAITPVRILEVLVWTDAKPAVLFAHVDIFDQQMHEFTDPQSRLGQSEMDRES